MKVYIKNMVCNRCITAVKKVFEEQNIHPLSITLGEVELDQELPHKTIATLAQSLQLLGFAIIDDKKSQLIEKIKNEIVQLVHYTKEQPSINLSRYLGKKLNQEYKYLSKLFSDVEGTTIEKYHIAQKIERVKELLMYGQLTVSEIADELGYSSVAYLSSQFKRVTGLTPTHFKTIRERKRSPLDNL